MHAKDDSEASVGSCALATKAGACLSPQGEFAKEPLTAHFCVSRTNILCHFCFDNALNLYE